MDFTRLLNQNFLENSPKQSDPTKQLLEQGMNFQKTMSGERGIMAAIEAAHLRPKLASFIKGKLNSISSDDILKTTRNIGTRLTGSPATRTEIAGPRAPPIVTENKVMGTSDTGLDQERGFQSLSRGIAQRFGDEPAPSIAASRLTRGLDATNNPLNPRNIENVGQSVRVPELETPTNLPGLRGAAPAIETEPLPRIPATTSEQIASLGRSVASRAVPSRAVPSRVLPQVASEAASEERTGALSNIGGRTPIIRTGPRESSLPPAPSLLQAPSAEEEEESARQVEAQAQQVSRAGEQARAIPKPPSEPAQAGGGTRSPAVEPDDFPSVPKDTTGAEAEDEELSQRLARVREVGSGEEEASSVLSTLGKGFSKALGAASTLGEGVGLVSAFAQKGLSGQQRVGQVAQTLAPRAAGKVGEVAADQFGLPKAPDAEKLAANVAEKAAEQTADKTISKEVGAQIGKTATVAGEEAEVPGIGDILAVGTALYGAIRGGIEAAKAKKEAEVYTPPTAPRVAMDNAVTFDSSFR